MHFILRIDERTVTKVGQFPSFADVAKQDTKKYEKLLGEERAKELATAFGLHTHGVGIGAFVYLRRVFEFEMEDTLHEALKAQEVDEDTYRRARRRSPIVSSSVRGRGAQRIPESAASGTLSDPVFACKRRPRPAP